MIKITEDYASFETAKLLKEKGFDDEYTNAFYDKTGNLYFIDLLSDFSNHPDNDTDIAASTLYVAMKWLREVHHYVICITPLTFYCGEIVSKWGYCIWADDNTEVDEESSPRLESYEEAAEAAIKYCLENLI